MRVSVQSALVVLCRIQLPGSSLRFSDAAGELLFFAITAQRSANGTPESETSKRPAKGMTCQTGNKVSEDVQLVQRCLAGDELSMRAFLSKYQGLVFSICLRMLGHREDAEDVAQDALVRVFRNLEKWDQQRPIKPWLLTIAANRLWKNDRSCRLRTTWPSIWLRNGENTQDMNRNNSTSARNLNWRSANCVRTTEPAS